MASRGGGGGNAGGLQGIPAASRKMVQSLKEIVNGVSEAEIYSTLKASNMDPNEAVNRLLSQDPFHEVKSKREKKREFKDTAESRPRGGGSTSNRGARSGTDNYGGRGGSTQISYSESGSLHGKPVHRRENGTSSFTDSSSQAFGMPASTANGRPPTFSDSFGTENKAAVSFADGNSSFSQQSSGFQSAWLGTPGKKSLADIVKMGRPQSKAYNTSNPSEQSIKHNFVAPESSNVSHSELHSSEYYASKVSEIHREHDTPADQYASPDDEWPSIEQPESIGVHSIMESFSQSELNSGQTNFQDERSNKHLRSQIDEAHAEEEPVFEEHVANHGTSAAVSSAKIVDDTSGSVPLYDNGLYENVDSYPSHDHAFEHKDIEDADASVLSVSANIQQLNIQEEKHMEEPEEDCPSLVIPNHLQVQIADCSHLSFGSFGANVNTGVSEPFASGTLTSNIEETPTAPEAPPVGHSETKNAEYHGDESIVTSESNLVTGMDASSGSYELPSASQAELLKQENSEGTHGNQYGIPPGYAFDNGRPLDPSFPQSQTAPQMQNTAPFPNAMQEPYSNSLQTTLLAANGSTVRESDLSYSQFPSNQSMPTKYGGSVSSIGSSSISVAEALKNGGFSSSQPTQQALPGNSVLTGSSLPPHLAMHQYSQHTLPLGPYANMLGYPFLPQSYTYMPSGFQQAFAGNSTYHQQLAAVLPQFKNNVAVSNLPQSGAVASGYGSFGSLTEVPGNYQLNQTAGPTGSSLTYDDVLNAHYKDNSQLLSLQQNENSTMWVQGASSRTVPASTYYGLQGQTQQPSGFRSQSYGAASMNHPNFYHSLEHQLQLNPRDGSQAQPKQQSQQQLWQNSY